MPARSPGYLAGPPRGELDSEQRTGAVHDLLELGLAVELETRHDAEPVAQRSRDQACAGCRSHQRELRQVQADRTGGRSATEDDVELEVLHGRVEQLLDRPSQTVDLIDEQHVAPLKIGQDGCDVSASNQGRSRGDAQACTHLAGHDPRQRGLPETRRPGEQDVVDRLAASARGLEDDLQLLSQQVLAHEVGQPLRTDPDLEGHLGVGQARVMPRYGSVRDDGRIGVGEYLAARAH